MTVDKSSRQTSKRWLMINSALGWAAIFFGILNELTEVAVAGLSFVTLQYGLYVGVGHLDYRQVVLSMLRRGNGPAPDKPDPVEPSTT